MTGWSYSDSDASAGDLDFGSTFGVVQPGESVILTETEAETFRTAWNLSSSIKIYGSNTNSQLGKSDEIHLYDASNNEVDSLVYSNDVISTKNKSCTIPYADLDLTAASSSWTLSAVGDSYGSWTSTSADIGNPGSYYAVPEPATMLLLIFGGFVSCLRKKYAK
jgi:predicted extracellular nuclease